MCGFDPLKGLKAVPSKSAYHRFLCLLIQHEPLVRGMFNALIKELIALFPHFGTNIADDGKAIASLGHPSKKHEGDQRREEDADWGCKKYSGVDQDGKAWEKIKSWFGFRLHLVVEADAELPIAYTVTKASLGEQPVMDELLAELNQTHPELIERVKHAMFDKGYDSTDKIKYLWDKYEIKPIIDIRKMKKDGETTWSLKSKKIKNVTYDYKGTIFCHCPVTHTIREMAYGGFEKKRQTLKYLCPAKHYGVQCKGASQCPLYAKSLRIPLEEDRRVFTPVARSSYKWKVLYNKRTSVERVNSRIDVSYGFERHYIRGLKKMELRCGLALSVMLAIALGRLREQQGGRMRSLVKTAA